MAGGSGEAWGEGTGGDSSAGGWQGSAASSSTVASLVVSRPGVNTLFGCDAVRAMLGRCCTSQGAPDMCVRSVPVCMAQV